MKRFDRYVKIMKIYEHRLNSNVFNNYIAKWQDLFYTINIFQEQQK